MERSICEGELATEWSGASIGVPLCYRLLSTDTELVYRASRAAAPELHPTATAGAFSENLWRYHCAEMFLATAAGAPYLEFNLAPNGAWWSRLFDAPRIPSAAQPELSGIRATGCLTAGGWKAELRIPFALLSGCGLRRESCRMCICGSLPLPERMRWLTAMPHDAGAKPDFHLPTDWPILAL